jgi:hypothetical protein
MRPASIGPPETKIAGIFTRITPISIPGMILSQFGMQTTPSKQCASSMDSTVSAMISREGSEYFMPACPMAMPSQIPIVLKMKGVPPASRTHSFT